MGVIVDGIIGPILEGLGIIQIGEDGEWVKKEREPRAKKESHWLEDIRAWFSGIIYRIKKFWEDKFLTRAEKRHKEKIEMPQPQESKEKTDTYYPRKYLKKITKFEGKSLVSSCDYKVWYGSSLPSNDEIKEGVVYVIAGAGQEVSSVSYLSGIRYDAYYIWDKEKYDEERKKEMDEKLSNVHENIVYNATYNAAKEALDEHRDDALDLMDEEHVALREEADKRWKTSLGVNIIDPKRTFTITPDSM
jgi:hypothetical protein